MSDVVIRVENLSKKYIIGHQKQERYASLRDVIANGTKSLFNSLSGKRQDDSADMSEEFWALKDVSFEIKQGDRVGIIGRNGAGKSTLLKILSRITEPTSGKISIKGRVASLLEVGTGFHPELTGRENIYLNGAILGMDRVEIRKKFDEIVAFAEVEKFLDTPVKRYSSGMYVRLAFAVAAHLEPEILIVDEVLAVGDAQFQKKCLGKMEDVGKEGRTVIFVSHNMGAIKSLCSTGVLLVQGFSTNHGGIDKIINAYLMDSDSVERKSKFYWEENLKPRNDDFEINSVSIVQDNTNTDAIEIYKPFEIQIVVNRKTDNSNSEISIEIIDLNENCVLITSTMFCHEFKSFQSGEIILKFSLPAYCLNKGTYSLNITSDVPNRIIHFQIHKILEWDVIDSCKIMSKYSGDWPGYLGPGIGKWSVAS